MPAFLRKPWRNDPMAALLVVLAICAVLWALSYFGQAVSLEITGQSIGQGVQLLNFTGEQLNVSIQQNGSFWNLSATGAA